jgi:hypothetical protein
MQRLVQACFYILSAGKVDECELPPQMFTQDLKLTASVGNQVCPQLKLGMVLVATRVHAKQACSKSWLHCGGKHGGCIVDHATLKPRASA